VPDGPRIDSPARVYTPRQTCCIVLYMSEEDDIPTQLDRAGQRLAEARQAETTALTEAMTIAKAAISEGMSEVEAARRAQVNRLTLRKHLGK
jgi:DNA-binding CsgD family transcriptional regulator